MSGQGSSKKLLSENERKFLLEVATTLEESDYPYMGGRVRDIANQDGHQNTEPSVSGGFGTAAREPSSASSTHESPPDQAAAIATVAQALLEVQHAQEVGANWYTRGASGLYGQVAMWVRKGQEAVNQLRAAQPPLPVLSEEAWLFHCWTPGNHCVFASIDREDKSWWPTDQWEGVTRAPLVLGGAAEVIHGREPPSASLTKCEGRS